MVVKGASDVVIPPPNRRHRRAIFLQPCQRGREVSVRACAACGKGRDRRDLGARVLA